MPVRINLKELFGSDSQTITIDKLNFNFNKLLELGIGLEGVRGITGETGSIGPSGIKGDQGDKGNQWFVGTSDPNTTIFPGLMNEDFYVLSDNSQIWQYDELTDNWVVIVDLGGIVNTYLNTAGTTFVRGFGEGSPQDSRYIMFPNRGNTVVDQQGDTIEASGSDNDILLLSNFNETLQGIVLDIDDDLSDTSRYYTALQKIYVDRSNAVNKRYHLELGSLNDVGSTGAPFNLSTLNQNLKLRHEYKNGIYNGIFSLTKLESDLPSTIEHNGIFDFQFAKFNAAPIVQKEGFVQLGSRYAHLAMGRSYVEFDGINFNVSGVGNGGIGIGEDFDNVLPHIDGNSYMILSTDNTGVNGIILDTNVYQDNGNIEQLGTGPVKVHTTSGSGVNNLAFSPLTYGLCGMAISGNRLFQISGASTVAYPSTLLSDSALEGYMFVSDLNNPNSPMNIASANATGLSSNISGLQPVGAAISDIVANGDTLYIVANQQVAMHEQDIVGSNVYANTYFQVLKFDTESGADFKSLSQISSSSLDGAYRVKLNGSKAVVATNHLRSWGDPAGTASNSQFDATGRITQVNIINEEDAEISTIKTDTRTHHLDLEVANNKAYTVTLEFNAPVGNEHPGFGISVRSHGLDEVSTSSYDIVPPNTTNIGTTNFDNLTSINKFAAIAVSGDIVWAIHKNILYTLKQDSTTGAFIPLNILAYHTDSNIRAMDIEVVGESLYILGASGNTNIAYYPTDTHLIKVNTNNVSSPIVVRTTDLGEPSASRLVVNGNNIYVNRTDGNTGYLIPIEIDGFKSDAIIVGSVKSTSGSVTNDLNVGHHLNVGQAVNVGRGGIKAIGPIASSNVLANRVGVNKDLATLDLNDFAMQISGNMLLDNTHFTGTTKIHFNNTSSFKHTEIFNISPQGAITLSTSGVYTPDNEPTESGRLSISGGGEQGVHIRTPDSAGQDLIGDVVLRPGDYTPPVPLPNAGNPPFFKDGVIILERRVQMINSIEYTENVAIGGTFDNSPFGATGLFLRHTISGGNWATDTFAPIVIQNSKPFDRIIRVSSGGSPSGTPPDRLIVWMESTPGTGSASTAGNAGGWHIAKRVPFDNYIIDQILIPSCHRFYVELDGSMGSNYTTSLSIRQYRFGKLNEGCNGGGNLPASGIQDTISSSY